MSIANSAYHSAGQGPRGRNISPFELAARTARPDCPKCRGTGSYMYDRNHGAICDLCCGHGRGRWRLSSSYAGWPGMCCVAGCGHVERTPLETAVRWALDAGAQDLIWKLKFARSDFRWWWWTRKVTWRIRR